MGPGSIVSSSLAVHSNNVNTGVVASSCPSGPGKYVEQTWQWAQPVKQHPSPCICPGMPCGVRMTVEFKMSEMISKAK